MVAPGTDIWLIKTDIEMDNQNQVKFNTWDDQIAYFNSCPKLFLDNATYQRKEGVIRYPNNGIPYDELIRYNYCMYRNESYTNKTFFAYIKNMRYVNDGMTEIEIETDVFQTWQFDIKYKKCFTEREHVRDDTFGLHTVPEGLQTGEYMYQQVADRYSYRSWQEDKDDMFCIVVATGDTGFDHSGWGEARTYNGVANGFWYIAFPDSLDLANWILAMQQLPSDKTDAIYTMFMCYNQIAGIDRTSYEDVTWRGNTFKVAPVKTTYSFGDYIEPSYMDEKWLCDPRIVGKNYKPLNNKVLCYPYRFINISNNAGQTNQYRYEYFAKNNKENSYICSFGVTGTISPGCNIKLTPIYYNETDWKIQSYAENYNGYSWINFNEGLDAPKLPICGWNSDAFLNWLSQNAVNTTIGTAVNITEMVAGAGLVASGAGAAIGPGLIASGAAGIGNTIKEGVQAALEPDTAKGGSNSGTLNFSCKRLFTPYLMSIRDEYAKIIDDYFTMFGYKVNTLKVPEIHSRKNWNYVKTIDCNFTGDIPGDDLLKLRSLFDNGITLWHNPRTFLDYSQSNNII